MDMSGTPSTILKGKCFYLFGFDIIKKKHLEDSVARYGGKICSNVDQQTTHFVTTSYEMQHMKGVIDELIGSFKIPTVNEDYIWSTIGDDDDEEYSSVYENTSQNLNENESMFESRADIPEGDLDSRWVNGRKVVSDISQEHSSYKYTPSGEFDYLAHKIYGSKENSSIDVETPGIVDYDGIFNDYDEGEDDLALSFNVPLHDEKIDSAAVGNTIPVNYEEFYNLNRERIEWQGMLASVLNGEVIESEKNRINKTINAHQHETDHYQRWIGIRARLHNRSLEEEKCQLEKDRLHVDAIVNEVKNFECRSTETSSASEQVDILIKKVEWVESLYPTRKALLKAKPSFGGEDFELTLNAINSWVSLTNALGYQMEALKEWTGSDTLQIGSDADNEKPSKGNDQPSFIERILKENSLQITLERRTLITLKDLLIKAKSDAKINYESYIRLNLADSLVDVQPLISFPTNLVLECLKLRLKYANRITKPTLLVIDQMLEDFRQSLYLACRIKEEYEAITAPGPGWETRQCIHSSFDSVLFQSLQFYFKLLHWKIKFANKSTNLKEIEILEAEWNFVIGLVNTFEKSKQEIAEQFCSLASKMLGRSSVNFNNQLRDATNPNQIKYFTRLFESFRLRVRKQMRFVGLLTGKFENASEYALDGSRSLDEMVVLLARDHVLVNTGPTSLKGVYIFLNLTLANRPQSIAELLKSGFVKDEDESIEPGYILVISSRQLIVWEGQVLEYVVELPFMDLKQNRVRLISNSPSTLVKNKYQFQSLFGDAGLIVCQPRRANLPRIHREMSRIKRMSFKIAKAILDSVSYVRQTISSYMNVDLIENCFTFASDFGQRVMKTMDIPMRAKLTLRLIRLAIDWVNFVFNDCVPTDRKTFRWAVIALEFAMLMTSGNNIVLLSEPDFEDLRSSVAGCMTLLISHFDIQGARSAYENASAFATMSSKIAEAPAFKSNMIDDYMLSERESMLAKLAVLEQKRNEGLYDKGVVGRILDDNRIEDRTLSFLATYANNMAIRWQQGKFLGAGAFGTVYSATNLDSGEIMAVKEFRFPDPSQLLALYKSIKEEMSVMKMLNHPNIVSYYGIEVHRDRVFIFMEFCQGGSLAGLLEHGRIEDENIVKIYTYQMLQGLEYLHNQNVLHRDIKPDNLLIDHLGVIKFVDFGAAKVIAKNKTLAKTTKAGMNKSLTGTPMYMAPEVITGGDKGNKGAQDIWSLGCCVLEMVTGKRPWANLDNEWAIMYHVASGHPPLPDHNQISSLGMSFIKDCFNKAPNDRPAAKQLLSHPWLKNIDMDLISRNPTNGSLGSLSSKASSHTMTSLSPNGELYNQNASYPFHHHTNSSLSSDNGFPSDTSYPNRNQNSNNKNMTVCWQDQALNSSSPPNTSYLVASPLNTKLFENDLSPSSSHPPSPSSSGSEDESLPSTLPTLQPQF